MMLESQKWADYQVTLSALESKVTSLEADKARLEAIEASLHGEIEELRQDRRDVISKVVPYAAMELVHSDELGRLVGKLVSSAITYGRCRAYEQVVAMKEPFDLSKVKGYRSSYQKEHTQASNDFATATCDALRATRTNAMLFFLDKATSSSARIYGVLLLLLLPILFEALSHVRLKLRSDGPSAFKTTQIHVPSSQTATPSSAPSSNLMYPPIDLVNPSPSPFE
ncbi:hypothetical protein Tco_1048273 [Tanacetum coccineum]